MKFFLPVLLDFACKFSMSSSADAASDVASEAPTQIADAKKKKSKKKTTIGVTSAALVDGTVSFEIEVKAVDQLCGSHVSQAVRDDVADRLVKLKLKEMFGWRFLNADPHMGNFVYNSVTKKLGLLDYGSCKEMDAGLAKGVARFMLACADGDRAAADAWFTAEGVVQEADEAAWGDQIFAYNAHLWQMFGSDAPFDFFAWYQDPKLQGFKQNVEYQNEAWSKQKEQKSRKEKRRARKAFDRDEKARAAAAAAAAAEDDDEGWDQDELAADARLVKRLKLLKQQKHKPKAQSPKCWAFGP